MRLEEEDHAHGEIAEAGHLIKNRPASSIEWSASWSPHTPIWSVRD